MPRPSKYAEQFRQDAVELVRSSGRTLRDVGRELGVNHETLRNWVNAGKRAEQATSGRGSGEPVSADEREGLRRLRKKDGRTGAGEGNSPQGSPVFCQGDGSMTYRYRSISTHRASCGVKRLCRVLAVRRHGFYEWLALHRTAPSGPLPRQSSPSRSPRSIKSTGAHAPPRCRRGHPPAASVVDEAGPDRRAGTGPDRPRLHRRRTRAAAGRRHHLPAHRAGVAVPGHRHRPCTPGRWSGTRWPSTCAPAWSARRTNWPAAAARPAPEPSSTPSGEARAHRPRLAATLKAFCGP